jgi:hypothetical protein
VECRVGSNFAGKQKDTFKQKNVDTLKAVSMPAIAARPFFGDISDKVDGPLVTQR